MTGWQTRYLIKKVNIKALNWKGNHWFQVLTLGTSFLQIVSVTSWNELTTRLERNYGEHFLLLIEINLCDWLYIKWWSKVLFTIFSIWMRSSAYLRIIRAIRLRRAASFSFFWCYSVTFSNMHVADTKKFLLIDYLSVSSFILVSNMFFNPFSWCEDIGQHGNAEWPHCKLYYNCQPFRAISSLAECTQNILFNNDFCSLQHSKILKLFRKFLW